MATIGWLGVALTLGAACAEHVGHTGDADQDVGDDADLRVDAGGDVDAEEPSDADAEAPSDADAEAPGDADADEAPVDPECIPGHDPNAPALRITTLEFFLPLVFHPSTHGFPMDRAFDPTTFTYLMAFRSLEGGEGGEVLHGAGVVVGEEYAFDPDADPPATAEVTLTGEAFVVAPSTAIARAHVVGVLEHPVDLRIREGILSGEFTTAERCSIGERSSAVEPTWRPGGRLQGVITLEDAIATRIPVIGWSSEFTLCAVLAGFWDDDGGCPEGEDPSGWPYPPDTTALDAAGEEAPAWTVDADFSAGAVRLTDGVP